MELGALGRTGLMVSPLCFGGNVFGWTADQPASFALLDRLREAGINFIDTADVYSAWVPGNRGGESETIIGHWLKDRGRRGDVVIASKVGHDLGEGRKGLSAANVGQAIDASLRRLQTDYVDLYQAHMDDVDVPFEETLGAFARVVASGKARAIGVSNISPARLRESLDVSRTHNLPRYDTVQPPFNLYARAEYQGALQDMCIAEDLGVLSYGALARGFLTGKYRSADDLGQSARGPGIRPMLDERGLAILAALDRAAERQHVPLAQIALAWLMAQPGITSPIVSATAIVQLDELLGSLHVTLAPETLAELNALG